MPYIMQYLKRKEDGLGGGAQTYFEGSATYDYETIWKSAESQQNSITEQFICRIALQYKIYFGLSYIEVREISNDTENNVVVDDGSDDKYHFLNTFCLAGPNGTIQGRVSKMTPCSVEAYYFRSPPPMPSGTSTTSKKKKKKISSFNHIIECKDNNKNTNDDEVTLRIGILICYENFIYDSIKVLQDGPQLDLLLQPFSGPLADDQNVHVKETLRGMYLDVCELNGKYLNCPTLYCNKVGTWVQPSPSSCMPMTFNTEFPGCSAIYDMKSNEIVGRLPENKEGILTRNVTLGRRENKSSSNDDAQVVVEKIPRYLGGYTNSTPFLKVCIFYEWLGSYSYKNDPLRKKLAKDTYLGSLSSEVEKKEKGDGVSK